MPSIPTLDFMRDWRRQLVSEWSDLDDAQEAEEKLYFQDFDVYSPKGQESVKTGSAPADADSAIDSITPSEILVRVKPARAKKKYRTQADMLMRFGHALLHDWRKHRDVLRQVASDMAIRRVGIVRVLVDRSRWPAQPSGLSDDVEDPDDVSDLEAWKVKNRRGNPIIFQHRNARHVRWREVDGELLVVVEHYSTTVLEAKTALGHYPEALRILNRDYEEQNQTVVIDDIWYGGWRCILVDDQPVFPGSRGSGKSRGVLPHGYRMIPYVIAPFRELPFDEPEQRFKGMLTNAAGLYPMESQVLSMQVSMLAWNAWRTFIGHTVDGRDLDISPGNYLEVNRAAGEFIEMMTGDPVPDEVLRTAAVFDGYIQRNGVAQGPSTAEGTRSGQQVWAIQAMRQMKVEPARQSLVKLVARSLELACMIAETVLADELTLPLPGKDRNGVDYGEVTVKPEDIDGYWDGWEITFGQRLDPALLEQAKALSALAANNWMPLKVSWEKSGLVDVPQEWEDELFIQATDRLDFILELAGLERVKNFYGEASWQYQEMMKHITEARQQKAAMQQMPGAPGMAGGGTMQPPGMKGPTAQPGADIAAAGAVRSSARPTGNPGRAGGLGGGSMGGGRPPAGVPGG